MVELELDVNIIDELTKEFTIKKSIVTIEPYDLSDIIMDTLTEVRCFIDLNLYDFQNKEDRKSFEKYLNSLFETYPWIKSVNCQYPSRFYTPSFETHFSRSRQFLMNLGLSMSHHFFDRSKVLALVEICIGNTNGNLHRGNWFFGDDLIASEFKILT